jgi:UDP-N-acetylmuramoyl-tripeptide--D-alanyl-D-alanine ligase
VRGENVRNLGEAGMRLTVRYPRGAFELNIPAFGSHLACAAPAAAAVGLELGLTEAEIARGVARYQTVGDRARVVHAPDMTVVSDCYNANPNSCQAAVDSLMQLQGERRVCILGDMLELGPRSEELHRGVGAYAARAGIDLVVGCGPLARAIASGARDAGGEVLYFEDKARLMASLEDFVHPGDCVLVKASHSMAFEEVVERLTEQ